MCGIQVEDGIQHYQRTLEYLVMPFGLTILVDILILSNNLDKHITMYTWSSRDYLKTNYL